MLPWTWPRGSGAPAGCPAPACASRCTGGAGPAGGSARRPTSASARSPAEVRGAPRPPPMCSASLLPDHCVEREASCLPMEMEFILGSSFPRHKKEIIPPSAELHLMQKPSRSLWTSRWSPFIASRSFAISARKAWNCVREASWLVSKPCSTFPRTRTRCRTASFRFEKWRLPAVQGLLKFDHVLDN